MHIKIPVMHLQHKRSTRIVQFILRPDEVDTEVYFVFIVYKLHSCYWVVENLDGGHQLLYTLTAASISSAISRNI